MAAALQLTLANLGGLSKSGQMKLGATQQCFSASSINDEKRTPSARASLYPMSQVGDLSPRSIIPTYVRWTLALAARASWESPALSLRSWITLARCWWYALILRGKLASSTLWIYPP